VLNIPPPEANELADAKELSVLLALDHVPTQVGIKLAIESDALRVVAEASSASEAVRAAVALRPDVCVLSVELPGSGIEAARDIKHALPATKIVMMTSSASEEDLFAALRAGADGYLLTSTSAGRLPFAIRGVASGEAALPRGMTARLILEFRERGMRRRLHLPAGRGDAELTAREFEILGRLRRHQRTSEIAARLGISEVTVRRHVSSVLRKLGTPNRRGAIEILEQSEREELQAGGPTPDRLLAADTRLRTPGREA
jgi:two-component system, NarL family, nitrate/nitrite response regulator NarL